MSGYYKDKIKSGIVIALCCIVGAAALIGMGRIVWNVVWNVRNTAYRQSVTASVEYARQHNSMTVTVDGEEPVAVSFRRVSSFRRYLIDTPTSLPFSKSEAGGGHATIDCGDGSLFEIWEAGARQMRFLYRSPEGKTYRYTLEYHTAYDGWDQFLNLVAGTFQPG